jgi:putative sigma-54 modulation protein
VKLQVKDRNGAVDPSLREYAEVKLARLEKQLPAETAVELELSEEKGQSNEATHVVKAAIFAKGETLRARVSSVSERASIDAIVDKLDRQVGRYRAKRRLEPRRHAPHHGV